MVVSKRSYNVNVTDRERDITVTRGQIYLNMFFNFNCICVLNIRTRLELNRRVNMVNQLKTSSKQLEQMLQDETSIQKYIYDFLFEK